MAISEKTVELNVSRTVVEKLRRFHQIQAYALGTTQTEEQMFGLDVEVTDGLWSAGCIQYKRLYRPSAGVWRWNLNRTTSRDQHSLLCTLQQAGFPVFYCFPKFDSEAELRQWTPPPLWTEVWWIPPMDLTVPAPVDDHHHLILDAAGKWTIHSGNGTPLRLTPTSFNAVEIALVQAVQGNATLSVLKETINDFAQKSWVKYQKTRPARVAKTGGEDVSAAHGAYFGNLLQGLGLMALGKKRQD